jgi:hypothetical protein
MTITLAIYLALVASPAPAGRCEELGPRLDGTYVTVCDGKVTRVRDRFGHSREWNRATNTVTVRSPGSAPMVLGPDGR